MKEIKTLSQELRSYPSNFFVYPITENIDLLGDGTLSEGLIICDMNGEQQGFIETGDKGKVVV